MADKIIVLARDELMKELKYLFGEMAKLEVGSSFELPMADGQQVYKITRTK